MRCSTDRDGRYTNERGQSAQRDVDGDGDVNVNVDDDGDGDCESD